MKTIILNQEPMYKAPEPYTSEPMTAKPAEVIPEVNSEISVSDFLEDTFSTAKVDAETLAEQQAAENADIPNENYYAGPELSTEEKQTPEQIKSQTASLIKGRDMLQQRALAYLAKSPKEYKKFALESHEFEWLCEVYGEYVGLLGKIPDWINIVIAELCIMIPKIQNAWGMRQLVDENNRLKQEVKKLKAKDKKNGVIQPDQAERNDTKTLWMVDRKGYFKYHFNNDFIREADRTEKPLLTPENYEKLCRHNGKESIDKIFGING